MKETIYDTATITIILLTSFHRDLVTHHRIMLPPSQQVHNNNNSSNLELPTVTLLLPTTNNRQHRPLICPVANVGRQCNFYMIYVLVVKVNLANLVKVPIIPLIHHIKYPTTITVRIVYKMSSEAIRLQTIITIHNIHITRRRNSR